jgi:hypothetical protein
LETDRNSARHRSAAASDDPASDKGSAPRRHFAEDKAGDYRAQPLVAVSVDPSWSTDTSLRDRATALESGCFRLLVAGDQRIVLLRPFRDNPEAELSTTVIRWEAIRMLRVLPYGRSCP